MARKLTIDIHDLQDIPFSCTLFVKPIGVRVHEPYLAPVEKAYTINNGHLPNDAKILPGRYLFRFFSQGTTIEKWEADVAESTADISINELYRTRFARTENFGGITLCRGDNANLLGSGATPAGWSLLSDGHGRTYWGEIADVYLTEEELVSALSQYYTKMEIAGLLAMKSDTGHNHDGRYFTRDEVNTLLDGKAELVHPHTIADITNLPGALAAKADLVNGVIPTSQIPVIAITDTFPVNSQAEMLALTAQRGDVAIRSDIEKTFILAADNPSILGNWKQLPTPAAGVISVNGSTGMVVLAAADVGAASIVHTHTIGQVDGLQAALDNGVTLNGAQVVTGQKTFSAELRVPFVRLLPSSDINTAFLHGETVDGIHRAELMAVGNQSSKKHGIEIINNSFGNGNDYIRLRHHNRVVMQVLSYRTGSNADYPDIWMRCRLTLENELNEVSKPNQLVRIREWQTGDAWRAELIPESNVDGGGSVVASISKDGHANFSRLRVRDSAPPASSSEVGSVGEFTWDTNYFYICTATNTWRRVAHSNW